MTANWEPTLCFLDQLAAAFPAGECPHGGVLFDEAVDKWAEDDGQNNTAAEDHHLFL